MINGHGDDLYRYEGIEGNFSSNVYSDTDNDALLSFLKEELPSCLGTYPEPEPYTLQSLLAEYHHVSSDCILVTNGASEAIYLVAHLLSPHPTSISEPTFSEYRSACEIYNMQITEHGKTHWICNPNNPTGHIQDEIQRQGEVLIVDRSYEYFCRQPLPKLNIDEQHIYIYSLTKRYKIPGLRLGYIISSPKIINQLRKLRQPWSVNSLAIKAGEWIVKHQFPKTIDREGLWLECERLREALSKIKGVSVMPTQTHFFLIQTPILANILKEKLALDYKLLVRDASNFIGLSPYHIRIATQEPAMNDRLIQAISVIMSALD